MAKKRGPAQNAKTPRRAWFDPRLAIGVALVVVSVAGVYGIVSAADRTEQVFTASAALNPGDLIHATDLVGARVRLGSLSGNYLTQKDVPAEGLVVIRTVAAGELVPTSAVGSAASIRVAAIVVTVSGQLAKAIGPGTVVDLWSATSLDHGEFGPPTVLVPSATVVRVVDSSGLVADSRAGAVEVLVPRSKVARVLEAVANGDAVSLVPVSLPVGR